MALVVALVALAVEEGIMEEVDAQATASGIAISRAIRSVRCRRRTFLLDIDLASFDSKKLWVLNQI